MDPTRPGDQAAALAATRRVLARTKLDIPGDEDTLPGVFSEEDRAVLGYDSEQRREDDLRVFAEWHAALGIDPEVALDELRGNVYQRVMGRLGGGTGLSLATPAMPSPRIGYRRSRALHPRRGQGGVTASVPRGCPPATGWRRRVRA